MSAKAKSAPEKSSNTSAILGLLSVINWSASSMIATNTQNTGAQITVAEILPFRSTSNNVESTPRLKNSAKCANFRTKCSVTLPCPTNISNNGVNNCWKNPLSALDTNPGISDCPHITTTFKTTNANNTQIYFFVFFIHQSINYWKRNQSTS